MHNVWLWILRYIVGRRYITFACQRVNRETAPRKRDFASIVHRFTGHWRTQHTEHAQHSRSRVDDQVCRGSRSFSDWEVCEVPFPGQRESPASWPLLPCLSTTRLLSLIFHCAFSSRSLTACILTVAVLKVRTLRNPWIVTGRRSWSATYWFRKESYAECTG